MVQKMRKHYKGYTKKNVKKVALDLKSLELFVRPSEWDFD